MNKKKILIVEDEKNIAQVLAFNIMQAGYDYDISYDGEDGLKKAISGEFDLILLDLMLPKMDGFEVCRNVRMKLATPIIIVTAKEEEIDKVLGLDIGADDYVTKPFAINELLSRIRANIRRSSNEILANDPNPLEKNIIKIRNLEIDDNKYQVINDGENIELTKKEYELLVYLANNLGKICTREEIIEQVWEYDSCYGENRMIDVTIRRLRIKLEKDPAKPEYLFTKRDIGYYIK